MHRTFAGGLTLAALALLAAPAAAQDAEKVDCVASKTDWSVCVEADPPECWSVSTPQGSRNTRSGKEVDVVRGEILLFVSYRPQDDVAGEVSFTGGYPFADGSTVTVEIGGESFDLFTEGEWAWPASGDVDAKIVAAMKRGAEAVLTGRSSRGTTTRDTFSLMGFTAAVEDAEKRCAP